MISFEMVEISHVLAAMRFQLPSRMKLEMGVQNLASYSSRQ
jgi:hypothetical protein